MSVRVQFVLDDEEYRLLQQLAEKEGVSISKYVKDRALPQEVSFKELWDEFCEKLSSFPVDIEFDVSTVMTQDRWKSMDRSTKLSIARRFNKMVTEEREGASIFSDIRIVGRSPANVSIYKKINSGGARE